MAIEEYKKYHSNGQLWVHTYLLNGKRNGEYKLYHDTGQLYIHTYYLNGNYHGEYKEYHSNGQLDIHRLYINGKEQEIDIVKLTADDRMYLSIKHGVQWL